ncbi:alpha-fucosidase [Penicillium angulare]|uniref:alpha-fucosidase n=1 Tax=Penicillium angulare TaxID=116970 RepID=UPI0025422148|nr:alpha-fucosidase [Penicillium angulare]KAJ5279841.1 alpha-fucosidase [Penicillium angulare]
MFVKEAIIIVGLCNLSAAKRLWSKSPASFDSIEQQAYPLGNGRLGFMPTGEPGAESINVNLDSLWSGGPFENKSYFGGNPTSDRSHFLPRIREEIFKNGTGNVDELLSPIYSYGSYTPLANLTVEIDGLESYSSYFRGLDLEHGVYSVRFTSGSQEFNTSIFCSQPDDICVYQIVSNSTLPSVKFGLSNNYLNSTLAKTTCVGSQLQISGQLADPGMRFVGVSQALQPSAAQCTGNSIILPKSSSNTNVTIVLGAGSDYDQKKGNRAAGFSFRGVDPTAAVRKSVSAAASQFFDEILARHVKDHQSLFDTFSLQLLDPLGSSEIETAEIISNYNITTGDPWLEALLVDYGRYLLIASSRDNSLPANLQGRWAADQYPAWSADYHADINIQMNYWAAPQVGLGKLQQCLWDFIEDTWVPYGQETASLLYGATNSSWVIHDEINTFGYTGMKNEAVWADFPLAGTWMALHIPNWLDYSNDVTWYRKQGYPLLKGSAIFWLSQLQDDLYFKDGTLVVNPCNSPEHGSTTFGCSMYQQQLWELFDRILATWSDSGDDDQNFYNRVVDTLARLDRGIHIGSWGQLQEWKLDLDVKNDTHRHLSGLSGWYPGYSVAIEEYNRTISTAVETMLWSRGDGKTDETNAGWEKVWRSACWARLNNTYEANYELRFAIQQNMAGNGLSQYSGKSPPFQIDANFGFVAAVTEILIQDLPQSHQDNGIQTIVLGPAISSSWVGGSVSGLQLRGGGQVDFSWDSEGVVQSATVYGRRKKLRVLNAKGSEIEI